jgi:hypothetical protein
MATNITTPVGRFVQGDLCKGQDKDASGRPLLIKSGLNAGQPTVKYFFAVAFPKTDPGWPAFWAELNKEARSGFPTLFDAQGNCLNPRFSWKIIDGDSQVPNEAGKIPAQQEGFPGCWVVRFQSSFSVGEKTYDSSHAPLPVGAIKRGSYIRVACSVNANGDASKPGLYVNPNMVQLCGYGPEIVSGPDAGTAFAAPVQLPAGASATPLAPAYALPAGQAAPAGPAGYAPPPPAAAPVQQAPAGQAAPAGPAGYAPPPPPAAPVQQAPAGYGPPPAAPAAYAPPPPPAAPVQQAPAGYAPPPPAAAPVTPAYGFAAGAPEPEYWVNNSWAPESALRASGYTDAHLQGLPRK